MTFFERIALKPPGQCATCELTVRTRFYTVHTHLQARGVQKQTTDFFKRTALKPPGQSATYELTDKPPPKVRRELLHSNPLSSAPFLLPTLLLSTASIQHCFHSTLNTPLSKQGSVLPSVPSLEGSCRNSKDWERVAAVIVQGAKWQFKDWIFKVSASDGGCSGLT
eukprot:scaffold133714_cov23-Tisochrysis_lutea.AAC.4